MIVCPNTSPLLVLARIERLDLLGDPAHLVLTRVVLDEVREKLDDATERINDLATRATMVDAPTSGHVDVSRSLGPGERSVLAWAVTQTSDVLCVFDDAAARTEARRLQLTVTGTLGLILKAKVEDRLDEAGLWVRRAVDAGLFLDDTVLRVALGAVGERWTREPGAE